MSSILILSDDFIFSEAITLLLSEVKADVPTLMQKNTVTNIFHANYQQNINHVLTINSCSALIVDIHDDLSAQTISILSRIKREYPTIRVMVIVNEFFDYQGDAANLLI